ncbi:hypothetical protein R6Q59_035789 [Mikania micrantha]|uniref:Cytochrome P450 n=1 Tax=Mikania micrantha TaxID=192012 RepID=A0A5N6NEM5_9ASTR|nr:hypothetical protein E3N88_23301 [Mikania micrantha]
MEEFYLLIPLVLLAITIFTDYWIHKLQKLPPRPWLPPLPIIGHLYLLKKPLHRSLAKLSANHGSIQLLQFGSRPVLVISSPSAAEECLTKNDIVFANRPQLLAGKYLGYNYTSLVFAPYGDHWRNLRRVASIEILSSHRLREFEPIRADEVRIMLRKLYRASSEKPTVIQVMGATNFGDYMPILRWLGVSKLEKRLMSLQAKRDMFMVELIEELKQNMKGCSRDPKQKRNLIQMLLWMQKSEPQCYTDEMIRSMMLVILAGGTDTSISTMEWAMSLLLNNPRVLRKAYAEIEKHVGHDRHVEESDLCNLPYLGCIIKETMRMYPAGPMLPHESMENCTVGGYHVPKGTMLLVNVWGIQNDPNIWGDPKTFRPERFESLEGYRDGFKLMPFGFGRRSCPGEGMSMRLVGLGLGSLIQCFEWDRTTTCEVDMSEGKEGISMPKAINLVAICRPRPTILNLLTNL